MPAELPWLEERRLISAAKQDFTWSFTFSDGATISTESGWRLITSEGVRVTSQDHGQRFGLPEPIDALARVVAATEGKKVRKCRLAERTSDLALDFEGEVTLQFLNLSCGFESWKAHYRSETIICMGGGEIAFLSDEK